MRIALVLAVGIATLVTVTAAQGAERWAAPAGAGTACTEATPCDLETAVESLAVNDGDEVIVTPGTYTAVALEVTDAIVLRGQTPTPTINVSASSGVSIHDAATMRNLRVEASSSNGVNVAFGGGGVTLERLYVHTPQGGGTACLTNDSALLRDSICRATGVNSRGVGSNVSTFPGTYTIRLRNVTAIGVAYGIGLGYSGPGVDVQADAANVIADGGGADVRAAADDGTTIAIGLTHSNYATEFEVVGPGGGSATVTNPGTGSNQTAAPLFVDAAGGDFHQQATSPTIDAGALDGFTGPLDYEGDARTLEGDGICPTTVDIGADEFIGSGPIDCDPPETTITGGPSGITNDPTPTFGLQSDEANSTFECKLDTGTFAPCNDPYSPPSLLDGSHTLDVRATDQAGNTDPTPASRTFTVDADPPETTITGGPSGTTADRTPAFAFSSDEPGSELECRIDGGAFAACQTPYTAPELSNGAHTLSVRAIDAAGNADQTPATRSFQVDIRPPETTIIDAPKAKIKTKRKRVKVSLSFVSDEAGRFECALDGKRFAPCSSPVKSKVRRGRHVWLVRAIDLVGNVDSSPAKSIFKVKRKKAKGRR